MLWVLLILFAGQFETTFRDGLVALNQSDLPLAESKLKAASALEPRNARVWLALAQTYWKLSQATEAQRAARAAETWAADDTVVLRALGTFYAQTGDFAAAIKAYET